MEKGGRDIETDLGSVLGRESFQDFGSRVWVGLHLQGFEKVWRSRDVGFEAVEGYVDRYGASADATLRAKQALLDTNAERVETERVNSYSHAIQDVPCSKGS